MEIPGTPYLIPLPTQGRMLELSMVSPFPTNIKGFISVPFNLKVITFRLNIPDAREHKIGGC
jgi:hypothetical protein